jgi:hypothetical protein
MNANRATCKLARDADYLGFTRLNRMLAKPQVPTTFGGFFGCFPRIIEYPDICEGRLPASVKRSEHPNGGLTIGPQEDFVLVRIGNAVEL